MTAAHELVRLMSTCCFGQSQVAAGQVVYIQWRSLRGWGNSERMGVGVAELCALSLSACCKCEKRFHASLNFSPTQWSKNFSPGCHKSAKGYYATLTGFNSRITNAFKAKLSIDIHISTKDWANANDNEIFKGIFFCKHPKKGATYWSVKNFCTKDC